MNLHHHLLRAARLTVLAGLGLCPAPGRAALDMYLSIPGWPGTSQAVNHEDAMEVRDFNFKVCRPPGAAAPAFRTLILHKVVDANSPLFADACANGGYLPGGTLEVLSSLQRYYHLQLDNVWVASVSVTNEDGEELLETVGLRFGKITWTFTLYEPDGINFTDFTEYFDQLFGQVPPTVTVTGVQNPGNGTMDLTWEARAGANYNILGSPTVDGTFTVITSVTGSTLGPITVTVPANGDAFFFQVEEVP